MATAVTGVEAVLVSNLTFYCPSRDGRWKPITIRTIPCTILLLREDTTRTVPHDLGDSALSIHPRPVLDLASTHCRSTRKKGRRGTGLRVFSPSHPLRHHGIQGWPAIPGAHRYSHLHRDQQNFTSKVPPVSLPPLTL
jgi:hypothetical protein